MSLNLRLFHGRNSVDEEIEDWGFDGPILEGVVGTHQTYGGPVRVVFADEASFAAAQQATGWEMVDPLALEMPRISDLCVADGKFYGDWTLYA